MCINLKTHEKQVASEEIEVIKVVNRDDKNRLCSPIFNGFYEPNIERVDSLNIVPDGFTKEEYRTTSGLYSFTKDSGLEECKYLFRCYGDNIEVWNGKIPKDAEYVKCGNMYCSDKLVLTSKIC